MPVFKEVCVTRCLAALTALFALTFIPGTGAAEGLTAWQKTKLVAIYPIAIHQLPLTTVHEGSHALTAWADWGSVVSEANEANNTASRIIEALPPVTPDEWIYLPMTMKQ